MRYFIFIILAFCSLFSKGNNPLPKWGDVSFDDLNMKTYLPDTNASAVILSDNGLYSFLFNNPNYPMVYERQLRIKILKSSGFKSGEIMIPYFNKKNAESVISVRAHTLYLDENQKKTEINLDKKLIFDQNIDGYYHATKFTFAGMKEGCILEYYIKTFISDFYSIGPWYFQSDIPTIESRVTTKLPDPFLYTPNLKGSLSISQTQHEAYLEVVLAGALGSYGYRNLNTTDVSVNGTATTYIMRNIPAFEKEVLCPDFRNYYSKINFKLYQIAFPGEMIITLNKDWDEVIQSVLKSEYIGKRIKSSKYFETLAGQITNGKSGPEQKTEAIYDYVRNNISWDDYLSIYADNDLKTVLENRKGNSSEINLTLLTLLKAAGLDAHMVLISTINNGPIQKLRPNIDQFNNVIISIHGDGSTKFLDATDSKRSIEFLDKNDLSDLGLEFSGDTAQWVTIINKEISKSLSIINVVVDTIGHVKASVDLTSGGHSGMNLMDNYSLGEENKFLESYFQPTKLRANFENTEITEMDSVNKNFKLKTSLSYSSNVDQDKIYFPPILNVRQQTNSFESEKRKLPINFLYPEKEINILNITIPTGYKISDDFKSSRLLFPDSSISFTYMFQVNEPTIQIKTTLERNRCNFDINEYSYLNDFYSTVSKLVSRQIVLEKK